MLTRLASKYWPLVLLVVFIGAILYMSRYAENRKAEHPDNGHTGSPKAMISPNGSDQSTQNANESHQYPAQYPAWIDTFAWPDGVTAWALFLTLLVIAWQSTETRDAAKAALLNAQAVINAERPWIVFDVAIDRDNTFVFSAKNAGRSAAKITSIRNRVPFIVNSDALPTRPDYREEDEFVNAPILLPPGEKHYIADFNFGKFQDANFQWASAVQFGGGKSLYIYGRIEYLAMPESDGLWETRYCQWYVPIDIPMFAAGRCPDGYILYK